MYYFIYRTTNNITGSYYIGAHSSDSLSDSYLGSGVRLLSALSRYGKENFTREILFMAFDKESMYWAEKQIVDIDCIKDRKSYNIREGGVGGLSEETILRIKETNLIRYGSECSLQNTDIRYKVCTTNIRRYGFDHHMKNSTIKDNRKTTVLKRYGVENVMQLEETKQKTYETNLRKRGVKRPAQDPEIRRKTADTFMERYGYSSMSQIPEVRKKISEANSGEKHNSFGKKWLHNPEILKSIKVRPEEVELLLLNGWKEGRGPKSEWSRYSGILSSDIPEYLLSLDATP